MERETARQEIRSRIKCTDYLTKSKSGLYCCPHCGSGTGTNGTGAVKYYPDTNTYFCHACKTSRGIQDGTSPLGCCGYGEICDYCTDNDKGRPCVRALNAMCREKRIEIDYSDMNFERWF